MYKILKKRSRALKHGQWLKGKRQHACFNKSGASHTYFESLLLDMKTHKSDSGKISMTPKTQLYHMYFYNLSKMKYY